MRLHPTLITRYSFFSISKTILELWGLYGDFLLEVSIIFGKTCCIGGFLNSLLTMIWKNASNFLVILKFFYIPFFLHIFLYTSHSLFLHTLPSHTNFFQLFKSILKSSFKTNLQIIFFLCCVWRRFHNLIVSNLRVLHMLSSHSNFFHTFKSILKFPFRTNL